MMSLLKRITSNNLLLLKLLLQDSSRIIDQYWFDIPLGVSDSEAKECSILVWLPPTEEVLKAFKFKCQYELVWIMHPMQFDIVFFRMMAF